MLWIIFFKSIYQGYNYISHAPKGLGHIHEYGVLLNAPLDVIVYDTGM